MRARSYEITIKRIKTTNTQIGAFVYRRHTFKHNTKTNSNAQNGQNFNKNVTISQYYANLLYYVYIRKQKTKYQRLRFEKNFRTSASTAATRLQTSRPALSRVPRIRDRG